MLSNQLTNCTYSNQKHTSLILICVAICWIRWMVLTWPFHRISLPNGLPQHFWFSWFTIFCNCIANPLRILKFCWLSLTKSRVGEWTDDKKWEIHFWRIWIPTNAAYREQQLLQAFGVACAERCPANWQFLCARPTNAAVSIHTETFGDLAPMTENLGASRPRRDHWNQLFRVYNVSLCDSVVEFPVHPHRHSNRSLIWTCKLIHPEKEQIQFKIFVLLSTISSEG